MFATLSETLGTLLTSETAASQLVPLLEHGPGCLYLLEPQTHAPLYLSPKADKEFPPSFFSLIKERNSWLELIHEEDRQAYRSAIENLNTDGSALAYRIATSKKNTFLPLQDEILPIVAENGETFALLGRFTNDSFRIQAMDTLVRRSWKEVATEITRRFMHDFNNMIAGIYSLSELYATPGSEADTMVEAMGHIRDNSVRAQAVTQKIRTLSAMTDSEPSYFDLEKLLADQEDYVRALLPKGTHMQIQLSGKSLPCHLDANRFKQVILHLAANARDAVGDEPAIALSANLVEEEGKPFGKIEFQDNGSGIKERNLPQALEPFYTTKDKQKHVGMGLFIAKSFAEDLGGALEIQSTEGQGTTVILKLPTSNLSETFSPKTPDTPASESSKKSAPPQKKQEDKKLSILIYTWEDVTRHPLINAIKDENWNYRIHLDSLQLLLDINELRDELDGIIIFKSSLDEKAEPLVAELANAKGIPPLALIPLGESVNSLPEAVTSKCALVSAATAKPADLIKKLSKAFSRVAT
ncbi:MAG: PAS domain-containing sensor histidine kinase [Verrucomicrobiota bacterium]